MDARHRSLWIATTPQTAFPTLDRDLDVDVAVVGGGIVGVTTAALLREAGARVALLEADRIVEGITGHTTAKLTVLHGTRLSNLLSRDEDRAHQYAEANQAGLDLVRRFVTDHWIDCELVETTMTVFAEDAEEAEAVEAEAEALRIVGLRPRHTPEARLPFPTTGAVTLPRQLSFHPRKYLLALAEALLEDGVVFERTRVTSLDEGARCAVATDSGHTVAADRVVLATGMPFLLRGLLFARATPSRGYAVAVDAPKDAPSGMFIAAGTPAHSIRDAHVDERRVLVLSGGGHHVGEGEVEERNWDELEAWGRDRLGTGPARFRWSTQDWYPADGLPFVGRASPGIDDVLVATGFGGWGMSNGTTAASLLADLCLGRESPYESLYDPGRLDARDLRGALAKGVKDATRLTRGRLGSHPRLDEVEPVAPGGGAVVSLDGETIAISRLADGSLAAVSAVCTHLGCVVDWNQAEGSWDCPCHGSRFAPDGSVLTGPAVDPLADRSELLAELPGARRPA